jgi:hypothetical protein
MRARSILTSTIRDTGGNVAAMFALAIVPFIGLGAAALDYAGASSTKSQMQRILDAAALMAVQPDGRDDAARAKTAEEFVRKAAATCPTPPSKRFESRSGPSGACRRGGHGLHGFLHPADLARRHRRRRRGQRRLRQGAGRQAHQRQLRDRHLGVDGRRLRRQGARQAPGADRLRLRLPRERVGSAQSGYESPGPTASRPRLDATKNAVRIALDQFKGAPTATTSRSP